MFRTILATITIAALLLCPLRCSATGLAEDAGVQTGCSCCQSGCADVPAQSTDSSPDDDCECANCLCHGAVLESGTELPSIVIFPFDADHALVEVALATPVAELMNRLDGRGDHLCLNGRAVRLLHQSLQI